MTANHHLTPNGTHSLSKKQKFEEEKDEFFEIFEKTPRWLELCTLFVYILLSVTGKIRELLRKCGVEKMATSEPESTKDFVPLYLDYEPFFIRNIYRRIRECWNQPICSVPGSEMDMIDVVTPDYGWTFQYPGGITRAVNLGSYNYLGFAENSGPCAQASERALHHYGTGVCSPRQEIGTLDIHRELEQLVAEYVGQEDAIAFGMGFATNSLNIPVLMDRESCVVSDELNHTSLILGCRLSGAAVKRFRHNDMDSLEGQLIEAVKYRHPKTGRPYNKIVIVVEGVYSMEGSIVRLPEVIALKKRYKTYLYLDEAHSIGALGSSGRGVVEYFGADPHDIDILMGTFTKAFGSCGGYLAGSKRLMDYLRVQSHSTSYGASMPGVTCQQIITSMRIIMGREGDGEGLRRISQLAWNVRYFRRALHRMGLIVYGNKDSPVVPTLIYIPSKVYAFSRETRKRGLGTVVVGFPATAMTLARARFCISAAHDKVMLDQALSVIEEVSDMIRLRYSQLPPPAWTRLPLPPVLQATGLHIRQDQPNGCWNDPISTVCHGKPAEEEGSEGGLVEQEARVDEDGANRVLTSAAVCP